MNNNNIFVDCFAVFKESSPLSFYLYLLGIPKKVSGWLVEDNKRGEGLVPTVLLKSELSKKVKNPELFRSQSLNCMTFALHLSLLGFLGL